MGHIQDGRWVRESSDGDHQLGVVSASLMSKMFEWIWFGRFNGKFSSQVLFVLHTNFEKVMIPLPQNLGGHRFGTKPTLWGPSPSLPVPGSKLEPKNYLQGVGAALINSCRSVARVKKYGSFCRDSWTGWHIRDGGWVSLVANSTTRWLSIGSRQRLASGSPLKNNPCFENNKRFFLLKDS